MTNKLQFDFGKNWTSYSKSSLTLEKVDQSRRDFNRLFEPLSLSGNSFLDIGFGQGLALFLACESGARVLGVDINPKNLVAIRRTREFFEGVPIPETRILSILELDKVISLGQFDVVHSWGVLHHTGDLDSAIRNVSILVKPGGHLVLAVYNRHWTSPVWWLIKRLYVGLPSFFQKLLVWLFYPVIYLAKWLVTGKNPKLKERGMDFYYDVIDWVGGFPYEYRTVDEVITTMQALGFECMKLLPANVPTGCNEFVFKKTSNEENPVN